MGLYKTTFLATDKDDDVDVVVVAVVLDPAERLVEVTTAVCCPFDVTAVCNGNSNEASCYAIADRRLAKLLV